MNEPANNPVRATASCLAGMAREDPSREASRTERNNFVKYSCLYQLHHQSCNGTSCINIGAQPYGNVFYRQVTTGFADAGRCQFTKFRIASVAVLLST